MAHKTDKRKSVDGLSYREMYSVTSSGISYWLHLFDLLFSGLAFSQAKANAFKYLGAGGAGEATRSARFPLSI